MNVLEESGQRNHRSAANLMKNPNLPRAGATAAAAGVGTGDQGQGGGGRGAFYTRGGARARSGGVGGPPSCAWWVETELES